MTRVHPRCMERQDHIYAGQGRERLNNAFLGQLVEKAALHTSCDEQQTVDGVVAVYKHSGTLVV